MPNPRKPDDERQRTNTEDLEQIIPDGVEVVAPEPAEHWLASTVIEWWSWWGSPAARYIIPESETEIVFRCFDLLDRAAVCEQEADGATLVPGSTGQMVINPLLKYAQSLRDEARKDEAVLGRGPKHRLSLGVKLGEAAKTLDEHNRRLARGNNQAGAPKQRPDPRQAAIDTTAKDR